MDIKDFLRLSKENERHSALEEFRRHEDIRRSTLLGSLNSASYPYKTLTEQLVSQRFSSSLIHDQVADFARQSAVLAAQCQKHYGFHEQVKQLMQGVATTDLLKLREDLRTTMGSGLFGFTDIHTKIESQTAALMESVRAAAMNPSTSALASISAAINETSILTTLNWIRMEHKSLLGIQEKTIAQLFTPSFAYDRFAARTLDQLRDPINHSSIARLTGSLLLANEQTIRLSSLVQPMVDLTFARGEALPGKQRSGPIFNRYRIQREELVESEDDVPEDADYETLSSLAPSVASFELARHCLELVGMCLETSLTVTGEGIFKLTPMVLISFAGLLGTIAWNRMTLTQFVENLYVILYESAGKDHLRYIEAGYMNDQDCEVIWKIKHLRNKWLSHDAEHGKARDIAKSREARMEALQWLGADKMPTNKEDYAFIHQSLLNKVDEFLSLLLTRIAGKTRSTGDN